MTFWETFEKLKRAHQYYLGFLISLPSFLSILYENVISKSVVAFIFPTFFRFILIFVIFYLPILKFLGDYFFEFKPNRPKYAQAKLDMKANPWNVDITKALILISEGKPDEVKELLERWL